MKTKKNSLINNFLFVIEKTGNHLPHPAFLFFFLTIILIFTSSLAHVLDLSVTNPINGALLRPMNLLSAQGLRSIIGDMVKNFSGFTPLGTVMVSLLGFNFAEKSGLIPTLVKALVLKSPKNFLIPIIFTAAIMSHMAGEVGYLLIPLGAMAFHKRGLHPLGGIAASFAGVAGGFSANFLISTVDTLCSGISQEAARIIHKDYTVTPVSNWYFMFISSFLVIGVGTLITKKVILPYLGDYKGEDPQEEMDFMTPLEVKALKRSGWVFLVFISLIILGLVPESGFLRDPEASGILNSSFMKGTAAVIFFLGSLTGITYGISVGTFKTQKDLINTMEEAMVTLTPYIVMAFFASQFIALFNHSNLGFILALKGSGVLKELNLGPVPLMLGLIILSVFLDLFIGSASAKWMIMAPIFVPMFMLLGISPELTQTSYRIADSVGNILTPLMPYFPLILSFAHKYVPNLGTGSLIALMVPYSLGFLIFWTLMLFLWMTMGWPLGPGAPLFY